MELGVWLHGPVALPPRENIARYGHTYFICGWVGFGAGLNVEKICTADLTPVVHSTCLLRFVPRHITFGVETGQLMDVKFVFLARINNTVHVPGIKWYSSPNIRVIESRRMGWAEYVEDVEENTYFIWNSQ
jgi:hypothetical protein